MYYSPSMFLETSCLWECEILLFADSAHAIRAAEFAEPFMVYDPVLDILNS